MLGNQDNPFHALNPDDFYLAQVSSPDDVAGAALEDELSIARKRRELGHLRRVQRANFVERAVIRTIDLFQRKDVAC